MTSSLRAPQWGKANVALEIINEKLKPTQPGVEREALGVVMVSATPQQMFGLFTI